MPKVIGFDKEKFLNCTCYECKAIVEYVPIDTFFAGYTDEGTKVRGIQCPNCNIFIRTNP